MAAVVSAWKFDGTEKLVDSTTIFCNIIVICCCVNEYALEITDNFNPHLIETTPELLKKMFFFYLNLKVLYYYYFFYISQL